jgi:hypothetical protein
MNRPLAVVRVTIASTVVEYIVRVNNRSRHALEGAVRGGWNRFPEAREVEATFLTPLASKAGWGAGRTSTTTTTTTPVKDDDKKEAA